MSRNNVLLAVAGEIFDSGSIGDDRAPFTQAAVSAGSSTTDSLLPRDENLTFDVYVVTSFGVFIVDVRTNIVIDEDLIRRAMRITGAETKRAVVDEALRELVRRDDRRRGMLELRGIGWEGDLDEMRRDRDFDSD